MTSTTNSSGSGTQKSVSIENSKFVLPEGLRIPDQNYIDKDGVLHVDITEDASVSLSPYQVHDPPEKSQDPAFNTFVNIGVSPSEAHFLIQNAHMAFLAAEKAAACRLHAENNGTTCEVLNHQINDLKNYVTSLQNRIVSLSSDKDEAISLKQKAETKLEEMKIQFDAIVSQRLEEVTKTKEATKLREEYDKSQTVLNRMVQAYSNLKDQYSEAIKIASVFAKERDTAQTQFQDINIQLKRLQLENDVRISNFFDVLDSLTKLTQKNNVEIPEDLQKKIDIAKSDDVNVAEFENNPISKRKSRKESVSKKKRAISGDVVSQSGQSEVSTASKRLESMFTDFVEPQIIEPIPKRKSPSKRSPRKSKEQSPPKIQTSDMDLVISDDSSAEEDAVGNVEESPVQESQKMSPEKSIQELHKKSPEKPIQESRRKSVTEESQKSPEKSVIQELHKKSSEKPMQGSGRISVTEEPQKSPEKSVVQEVQKSPEKSSEKSPVKNMVLNADLMLSESSAEEDNVTEFPEAFPQLRSPPKRSPRKSKESPSKSVVNMDLMLSDESAPEEGNSRKTKTRTPSPQKSSPRKAPRKQHMPSPSKILVPNVDLVLSEESSGEEDVVSKTPGDSGGRLLQEKPSAPSFSSEKDSLLFGRRDEGVNSVKIPEKNPPILRKSPMKKPIPIKPSTSSSTTAVRRPLPVKPIQKTAKRNDLSVFAKEAQPPSALNNKNTVTAGAVPSIHGRKTITVREMQQQMMTKDKKEILERLRKEQENMPASKPLPKKATVSIVQKPKRNVSKKNDENEDNEEAVIVNQENPPVDNISEENPPVDVVSQGNPPDQPTSGVAVDESKVEIPRETIAKEKRPDLPSTTRVATRSSIAPKRGQTMAQIMRNLSSRTKMRLATATSTTATSVSKTTASTTDSGPKRRGRKANPVVQSEENSEIPKEEQPPKRKYTRRKKASEATEEAKTVESPSKKRRRIISEDEDDVTEKEDNSGTQKDVPVTRKGSMSGAKKESTSGTQKEGPSTFVQPATVPKRVTRRTSKRDPVLELRGLLQKCTHSNVPLQVSEFITWAPTELKLSEVVEIIFGFLMKLNSKNCWSLLLNDDNDTAMSKEEENLLHLCEEFSKEKTWGSLIKELFGFISKKQLSNLEKMNLLEVNRNYRIIFGLFENISSRNEVSDMEVAYQDSLLDNLVLNRSPDAVITTFCYLLEISPSSMKKFIVRRVIEDNSGFSDLLVMMVNGYPKEKEVLKELVEKKAEIDFENSKLSRSVNLEEYSDLVFSKIGDVYFSENGLSEFDMDGEMIYSISVNIQKKTSLMAALFSSEIFKEFDRGELLEKIISFIRNIVESVAEGKKEFNDSFYDKINETYFDRDLDPVDPGNVGHVVQLLYVVARLVSLPFRRLSRPHLPQYAKSSMDKFLNEVSLLERVVGKCDVDDGWKQKINFGLKDAIDHVKLSMK